MKPTVFIPEPISPSGVRILESKVECVIPWKDDREPSREESRAALYSSEAVIVRLFKIELKDLEKSSRLRVIAKHGVGVDNVDTAAAAERNIQVVYTPEANSNAVAEHTIALILALARRIEPAAAARTGRFSDRNQLQGVELAGKTLGVIGLGRIGKKVAAIASLGFGMKALAFDPIVQDSDLAFPISICSSAEEVLKQADILTLHAPLTSETRHWVGEKTLSLLKPGCRIVNTSRGGVIDETALLKALEEGRIAGAALDVFEEEPLPLDHPLCKAPNVLLTPHISSSTQESLDRMAIDAAQGVLDVLEGKQPRFPYPIEVSQ